MTHSDGDSPLFQRAPAPSPRELRALFRQTTWAQNREEETIERMLAHTPVSTSVRINGRLIGYGRALTDCTFRALLDDLVVDEAHRGQGIGGRIVDDLLDQLGAVEEVFLNTSNDLRGFYTGFAFEAFPGLTMVRHIPSRPAPDGDPAKPSESRESGQACRRRPPCEPPR